MSSTGKFAISILAEQSDAGLIGTFGFQSGKDVNKFEGVEAVEREGISVVADACSYLVCKVINKMETATHTVFLGEVIAASVDTSTEGKFHLKKYQTNSYVRFANSRNLYL